MSVIVTISLPIWCTKWSCPQHFTREPTFFFSRCPFLARILLQPCFLVYMLPFSFHFGKEIKIYSYGVTIQGLCFPFTPFLSPIFNHPFVVSTLFLILHIVDYISLSLSFFLLIHSSSQRYTSSLSCSYYPFFLPMSITNTDTLFPLHYDDFWSKIITTNMAIRIANTAVDPNNTAPRLAGNLSLVRATWE